MAKSRCQQGHAPSESFMRKSFLLSIFWASQAFLGCSCITLMLTPIFPWSLCVFPTSFLRILLLGFRAHCNPGWFYREILTWLYLQRPPLFVFRWGHIYRVWWAYLLKDHHSTYYSDLWGNVPWDSIEDSFWRQCGTQWHPESYHWSGLSLAPSLTIIQLSGPCVRSLNSPSSFPSWSLCIFCKISCWLPPFCMAYSSFCKSLVTASSRAGFLWAPCYYFFFKSQLLFVSFKAHTTILNYLIDYFLFFSLNWNGKWTHSTWGTGPGAQKLGVDK